MLTNFILYPWLNMMSSDKSRFHHKQNLVSNMHGKILSESGNEFLLAEKHVKADKTRSLL